jgi:type II secretory pathway predicted ATPase ExeA/cell division septation protein DedD
LGLSSEPIRHSELAPFEQSPDPRFFFNQSSHGETLEQVLRGIQHRDSVLVVTGESGVGKSAFCAAMLQSLGRSTISAFVRDAAASREELLKTLLVDFGIISADNIRHGPLRDATRTDLRFTLHEFLSSLEQLQAFAVVVIDEAHKLSNELLHEIHLLSVLELRHRLLVFVLVGQPELKSRLDPPEMHKLMRRVSTWTELSPLARKEVRPYVMHRLTIADDATRHFTEAAIDMMHAASGGIPRVINLICDRALSRVNQADTIVDAEDILNAIAYLQLPAAKLSQLSRERAETKPESLGGASLAAANPTAAKPTGAADAAARSSVGMLRPQAADAPQPGPSSPRGDEDWLESFVRRTDAQMATAESGSAAVAADADTFPFVFEPNFETPYEELVRMPPRPERRPWKPRRFGLRQWSIAGATVATAIIVAGFWISRGLPEEPRVTTAAPPQAVEPPQAVAPPAPAPEKQVEPEPPAPAPIGAASTAGAEDVGTTATGGSAQPRGGTLAVRLETFHVPENAARTVEVLRRDGYPAYSTRVTLPSGKSAVGVFLGPYTDRAEAERDLRRVRRDPEYADAHVSRIERPER